MSTAKESADQSSPLARLKDLVLTGDSDYFKQISEETRQVAHFSQAVALNTMRKRAESRGLAFGGNGTIRIGIVGGPTLRPLADLVEHFTSVLCDVKVELWVGEYDLYISEIMEPDSELYEFKPDTILILPSDSRCHYSGTLADPIAAQRAEAERVAEDMLALCRTAHERSGAEVVVCNFPLPPNFDPGPMRSYSLGADYGFRKYVNMHLGLTRSSSIHICDVEFLANRIGTAKAIDERAWFESKQPYAAELTVQVAKEFAQIQSSLKRPAKKVVVLDLDNTLWGGVIGDDGIDGIEIGTTSPRGEAFRHFQSYLKSLSRRGILLTICSKNDYDKAIEPFESHPEMVLRLSDIVNIKANWEPKSENIRQIAEELNLGLDSFVFVDDNPAEIEIVRQFVPEVTCICVGEDPSIFASILKDSRLFEVSSVTREDLERVSQYRQDADRQQLMSKSTDMDSYLASLEMTGNISSFTSVDAPRISQLINKSNQFNLTTRRRTESEVLDLIGRDDYASFTMRLTDKFGEHGLICVIVGKIDGEDFEIDTWLMSCRVLKRGVEQETLNEIVRLAEKSGCKRVVGVYIPTKKNGMVCDLYPRLGFAEAANSPNTFTLATADYIPASSHIQIHRGEQ